MKTTGIIHSTFNQVMQKFKKCTPKLQESAKQISDYVAVNMNGLIVYMPLERVPKGAEILSKPLTSGAEVLAKINEGLVNKITK